MRTAVAHTAYFERKASDNCKATSVPLFSILPLFELLLCVPVLAAPGSRQHAPASRRSPCSTAPTPQYIHKPLFHISALLPDRLSELLLTALAQAPSVSIFKYGPGAETASSARFKYPSVNPCRTFFVYSAFIILNIFSIVNVLSMVAYKERWERVISYEPFYKTLYRKT